ncbi:matrixin family metalloprotease [Paenibacillus jilunlii]|uniref:Matrixin n=1 Tax=Paenibacillus jilunlii TaxID=682956 RepID=A0A1G9RL56_9BACL|nr:matrixin family metalloprotease [Paenibacillus jilunlii]SDM23780.1 Matrixin [Paenibacillus jilunlii]
MKKTVSILSASLLLLSLLPSNVFAYTYSDNGKPFPDKNFTYYSTLSPNYSGPAAEAMADWSRAVEASYTAVSPTYNEIQFSDNDYGATEWNATTDHHHVQFSSYDYLDEVRANRYYMGSMSSVTREGVFGHELGHVFGLGHTTNTWTLMCTSQDGRVVVTPQFDDIQGVESLY